MTTYQLTRDVRSRMIKMLREHFDREEFIELVATFGGPRARDELIEGTRKRTMISEYINLLEAKGGIGSELFAQWREQQEENPARLAEISALEQELQMRGGVTTTKDLQQRVGATPTTDLQRGGATPTKALSSLQIVGDPDALRLICKVSGSTFVKSTKAIELPGGGCLVQVSTKERNLDGSFAVAEAMSFVPGVRLAANPDGKSWRFTSDGSE